MDAIFSFSYKPLRLGLALGSASVALGLIIALLLLISSVFGFRALAAAGFAGTLLAVLLLAGVQLVCTGLLGEYIGRIYDEVRRRPLFLIQTLHQAPTVPVPKIAPETTVRVQVADSARLTPGEETVAISQNVA
jgi:dolichol-phosphate mannosyltransferase